MRKLLIAAFSFLALPAHASDMGAFSKWNAVKDARGPVNTWAQIAALPYRSDKGDTWKTPAQFYREGGDCEDYAIAYRAALLASGTNEADIKLLTVQSPSGIHSVLVHDGMVYDILKPKPYALRSMEYTPVFWLKRDVWGRDI